MHMKVFVCVCVCMRSSASCGASHVGDCLLGNQYIFLKEIYFPSSVNTSSMMMHRSVIQIGLLNEANATFF